MRYRGRSLCPPHPPVPASGPVEQEPARCSQACSSARRLLDPVGGASTQCRRSSVFCGAFGRRLSRQRHRRSREPIGVTRSRRSVPSRRARSRFRPVWLSLWVLARRCLAVGLRGVGPAVRRSSRPAILRLQIALFDLVLKHVVIIDVLTIAHRLRAARRRRRGGGQRRDSATGCWSAPSCWRCSSRWRSAATRSCCWPPARRAIGRFWASTVRICSIR